MDGGATLNNAGLFAAHAGNDIAIWKKAEGRQVTHTKFGEGTIMEASLNTELSPRVHVLIRFPKDIERTFLGETFCEAQFFSDLQLPTDVPEIEQTRQRLEEKQRHADELAEQQQKAREQREKEQESATQFGALKKKYRAQSYPSSSPSDPLYPILLRIDEGELLDDGELLGDGEVRRLESHGL